MPNKLFALIVVKPDAEVKDVYERLCQQLPANSDLTKITNGPYDLVAECDDLDDISLTRIVKEMRRTTGVGSVTPLTSFLDLLPAEETEEMTNAQA